MQTAPLNVLDELYLNLDRPQEPWSVHVEIRVEGRIDAGRLEAAVAKAALAHPIARARLGDTRASDVHYRWEIAEELDHAVDAVIDSGDCGTEPTTVIDFSQQEPEIVRRGAGDTSGFE